MIHPGTPSAANSAATPEDEASAIFVQRLYGEWSEQNQTALETCLANDGAFAQAYRRVEESWRALDTHAQSPELMTYRAEAIDVVRRANARRWFRNNPMNWFAQQWQLVATVTVVALLGAVWQLSSYGYRPGEYRTAIGEQRIVELADHSRITLDAATRIHVSFTNDARTVRMIEGQAQFSVAKDPSRPFKVIAGGRTIVAVGTVFTVEYVQQRMHVAMIEGKVAVFAPASSANAVRSSSRGQRPLDVQEGAVAMLPAQQETAEIYLVAGEELHVAHDGQMVITPKADLEVATAWREGKVIFRSTPLGEAVNRMNRYSHLQLQINDTSLAAQYVSGVFEAGDTRGFVSALERYFSVTADYSNPEIVRLTSR
jgi:transmembrane sensor